MRFTGAPFIMKDHTESRQILPGCKLPDRAASPPGCIALMYIPGVPFEAPSNTENPNPPVSFNRVTSFLRKTWKSSVNMQTAVCTNKRIQKNGNAAGRVAETRAHLAHRHCVLEL